MTLPDPIKRFFSILGAPFRAIWGALNSIASLDRRQVRSLVTVGFLAGMVSLSAENWAITFVADEAASRISENRVGGNHLFEFITERMRWTSALQGLITVVLGAVILNADRMSVKGAGFEASIGGESK